MLNMIRMELYRMFRTKSLYVIWMILTAGIIFTTYLGAEEWKSYTMEEKQEQYAYATGELQEEQVNFGMSVTIPTKPGADVTVFDLFYANIKGKFIVLFMVIFAVLFSTADMTSGFVKNIAGQVRDRRGLIVAKVVSLLVFTVSTIMLFVGIQTISNAIFFEKLVFGSWEKFFCYGGIQTLLHFALVMVAMCLAIVLRNNVISMVLVVCMCMNALVIFYGFIDKCIANMGTKGFHVIDYTVSGKIMELGMDIKTKAAGSAAIVAIAFLVVTFGICSTVFQKRDI